MKYRNALRRLSDGLLVAFASLRLAAALAELTWVEVPQKPATQPVEGSNVTLRWDYNLTGDTVFQVLWLDDTVFPSKTIGRLSSNNPVVFQDYRERFAIEKDEKATLVIRGVTRAESGGFRCQVHTNLGSSFDSTIEVDVLYQPENTSLTVHDVNTSAVELNDIVNFTCASLANPDPHEFKLFVNGHDVHNSSSGLFSFAVSQPGNYSCVAVNTVGSGEQSSSLPITVFVRPGASVTSYANVTEGKDLNLTCNVTGSPLPSVEWSKVGDPAAVLSSTSVLTLHSVTRPGNANQTVQFRCTARNGYGEPDSAEVTVQVLYPPENTNLTVHFGNVSAIESGTVVNFTCSSAAFPAPHAFKLLVDGNEVHSSSSKYFSLAATQRGVYSCEAVNTVGRQRSNNVSVGVFVLPGASLMSYANVTEGKDLNLTCHVTGTPLPSVEWTKVDDPAAVLPRTSVLTLRSVTRPGNANQTVQYRCTANNGYGEPDSAEVTVQVLSPAKAVISKPTAVEGSDVVLNCTGEGFPTPHVDWIASKGTYLQNGTGGAIYTVKNVSRYNNYSYECRAENKVGSNSKFIVLDVLFPARVTAAVNVTAVEGSDALLVCEVEGNPVPLVSWTSPNGTVLQNRTSSTNLTLLNVSRHSRGEFVCQTSNNIGQSDSKELYLDVLFPAKVVWWSNETVVEGNQAVLACAAAGNPAPRVVWTAPNGSVVQNRTSDTNLTLPDASRDQGGTYKCNVTNGVGWDSKNVHLDVLFPARVTAAVNVTAVEGSDALLVCEVEGNPVPLVSWTSPNGTVLQNRTSSTNLTLLNVSRHSRGEFVCQTSNNIGQSDSELYLDVLFPAKVVWWSNVTVVEGNQAVLACTAEGNPTPRVVWTAPNGSVVQDRTSDTNLTLPDATRDQGGTYKCNVTNGVGWDSKNVHLDVLFPARVTSAVNVTAVEGSDALLVCEVEGNPTPFVTWMSPNGTILQNRTSGMNLTLSSVSRYMNGTYRCNATNKVGSDAQGVSLRIRVPARVISVENQTVVESNEAVLVCAYEGNPTPRVIWIAPNGTEYEGSRLKLPSVSRINSGLYRCNVTNAVGSETRRAYLDVQYPPRILNVSVNGNEVDGNSADVDESANVRIEAEIEGNPKPEVEWHPPGNQNCILTQNGSVWTCTLKNISREGSGNFSINANNTLNRTSAKFELNVKYIEEQVRVYLVSSADWELLLCEVDGYPVPNVTMTKMENATITRNDLGQVKISVKSGESGSYNCSASNYHGTSASKTIVLRESRSNETINVAIEIIENFTLEYRNTSNELTRKYIRRIAAQLSRELKERGIIFENIRILSLRPGSVLVNFTVTFGNNANLNKAYKALADAIASGQLGNLPVNSSYVKLTLPTTQTTPSPTSVTSTPPSPTSVTATSASNSVGHCKVECKNGTECNPKTGKCECEDCGELSLIVMVIIAIAGVVFVVVLIICLCCWCKTRTRRCRKGSVESVDDEIALKDRTDGRGAAAAVRNLGYADEGPAAGKDTSNAPVDRGAAEGGYTTVGVAGGVVPDVTYAAVEASNDKKKKKKKGKKEKEELQGTPLYAQVDKSKKAGAAPDDYTYAQVDMSKKKKKPKDGDVTYADLAQFSGQQRGAPTTVQVSPPTTLAPIKRPPQYENTEYADIAQFSLKRKEAKPAEEDGKGDTPEEGAERAKPDGEAEPAAVSPAATPSAVTLVKEEGDGENSGVKRDEGGSNDSKM